MPVSDEPRDLRRVVRHALALGLLASAAGAIVAGVTGVIAIITAVLLALAGAGVATMLPRGGRPAAWLFALWCAAALITAARAYLADELVESERIRLAVAGGALYLGCAAAGFWACGIIAPRRDE